MPPRQDPELDPIVVHGVVHGIMDLLDNFLNNHPGAYMTISNEGNYYPNFYLYLRFGLPPWFQRWFITWLRDTALRDPDPEHQTLATVRGPGRGLGRQRDPVQYYLFMAIRQQEPQLPMVRDYWQPGPGEERRMNGQLRRWANRADMALDDPTAEYARVICEIIVGSQSGHFPDFWD